MTTAKTVFLDQAEWLEFHPVLPAPVTGDEHLAGLVGYMIGDGAIATRSDKYVKTNGDVSTYAPHMKGAFYSNNKGDLEAIQSSLHSLGMALGANVTSKKASAEHLADGYQIQIGRGDCATMVEAGVPCGKKTQLTFEVPDWILKSEKPTKRAFLAALFGAEGSTPSRTVKDGVRTPRPITMTMCKIEPMSAGDFFTDIVALLSEFGITATHTTSICHRFGKNYVSYTVRISGLENQIAFFEGVGYFYCSQKALLAWKWLNYLKAYRVAAQFRRDTVRTMTESGAKVREIGVALGLTIGAAARLRIDLANGRSTTAGHSFPQFKEWIGERWCEKRGLLRLKVKSCTPRVEKQSVWNLLVGSHDHSYLLANGANNFNSFESMSGRVYYPFDRKIHVKPLSFNPELPIWIGQDFNIDPMSSVVFQRQKNGELWAVDEICLLSSNTSELCDELERRYWRYLDQIIIYPDPAGAYRGHQRGESDLDIFRERGFKKQKYRKKHPPVDDRVNAVNRMLQAANGAVRMYVDPRCKKLIEAFEQTQYVPGSREVDKKAGVEHAADAAGYCIEFEHPVHKVEVLGISI